MKLDKYIRNMLHRTWPSKGIPSRETIGEWILEWYINEFGKMPPTWLADWRKYE